MYFRKPKESRSNFVSTMYENEIDCICFSRTMVTLIYIYIYICFSAKSQKAITEVDTSIFFDPLFSNLLNWLSAVLRILRKLH